jgi:PTS system mannose-specific IIA component
MIGLVIVTHGRLADEFRRALEHVMGPQRNVATVCIGADDDLSSCLGEVRRRVEDVDSGDGVVLLTDMFGGTPSNFCIAQMARPGVEVLGGVNLPLLVKLAKVRSSLALSEAVSVAQAAGRKYLASASDVIPHCKGTEMGGFLPPKPQGPLPPLRPGNG